MNSENKNLYVLIAGIVVVLVGGGYYTFTLAENLTDTHEELSEIQNNYNQSLAELSDTRQLLSEEMQENKLLREALEREQNKNEEFEDQIRDLAGTVGDLEKLSETDPELLQKYSRVYFLNEHYTPERLSEIDSEFVYESEKTIEVHSKVAPFLEDMLEDAKDDDVELQVVSGFRSFDTQSSLKSQYDVIYGAGTANQFSAAQGYSEHQLGTTVDFTTPEEIAPFTSFETTEAYEWLTDNAHKYGFTLSYPKNNSFYQFEPWHWRFVGEDLADDLHDRDQHFYDLDQRDIDKYLIDLFD